jgi:hypothetical protein
MSTSKVPLTISYHKAGTKPPLFIAGEFSDPHWHPLEMEYVTDVNGDHTFTAHVLAEPGSKVQYKFRIGIGDWWVLDEDAPTSTDSAGNLNNVLTAPSSAE